MGLFCDVMKLYIECYCVHFVAITSIPLFVSESEAWETDRLQLIRRIRIAVDFMLSVTPLMLKSRS